jgi:hypothetical protein
MGIIFLVEGASIFPRTQYLPTPEVFNKIAVTGQRDIYFLDIDNIFEHWPVTNHIPSLDA